MAVNKDTPVNMHNKCKWAFSLNGYIQHVLTCNFTSLPWRERGANLHWTEDYVKLVSLCLSTSLPFHEGPYAEIVACIQISSQSTRNQITEIMMIFTASMDQALSMSRFGNNLYSRAPGQKLAFKLLVPQQIITIWDTFEEVVFRA